MSGHAVLDLFAGVGVGVACKQLGAVEMGVEFDANANLLRASNGMETVYENVWDAHLADELEFDTIWASPPCFTAGAPVLTERGVIPIEEVKVGDLVLTHKGRWREVTDVMSRKAETVTFGNVTCTPDHPFYTARQWRKWRTSPTRGYDWGVSEPEWVAAKDTYGSFLSIPLNAERQAEIEPPLHWWLVGRWIADGWGQPSRREVCVAVGAGKEFEFEGHATDGWRSYQQTPSSARYVKHDVDAIKWLVEHFGSGAHGKTIPGWLLSQSDVVRRDVLDGYLSGDGNRQVNGWGATTVSANLAIGIRLLAESLGWSTNVVRVNLPTTTTIEGRAVNQSGFWRVNLIHSDGRYSRSTNLHRWVKQRKKVESSGLRTVYDITVAEDHSFVCWGFVVHNCQSFSMAGKGAGRKALDDVLQAITDERWRFIEDLRRVGEEVSDDRTALVLTPLHYAFRFKPTYLALEQVPPVLPVWEAFVPWLERWGYSVWTGIVQAETLGVPQTRKRAILMARRDGVEVEPPAATHSRYYSHDPKRLDGGVEKWVSMVEALDALGRAQPSLAAGQRQAEPSRSDRPDAERFGRRVLVSNYGTGGDAANRGVRTEGEPSATVTEKVGRNKWAGAS